MQLNVILRSLVLVAGAALAGCGQTLPTQLKQLAPLHYLQAELHVQAPRADGFGMHGSGMWVINPPYLLAEQLQQALPQLVTILGQDAQARFVLQHQAA